MPTTLALERAAQVWCTPATENIVFNGSLANAFADILDEIWSKPWLGNATTGELLDELRARAKTDGSIDYKTVNIVS
jgi:hypothetical protein